MQMSLLAPSTESTLTEASCVSHINENEKIDELNNHDIQNIFIAIEKNLQVVIQVSGQTFDKLNN